MKVENGGVIFEMQIWTELPVKAYVGERRPPNLFSQKVVGQDMLDKGLRTDMGQVKGTRQSSHALHMIQQCLVEWESGIWKVV